MPKSKEPSLEQQLKRLELIVERLENEDAALDESLALFEEGVALTRQCRTQLDKTQKKIEVLIKETGELKPFELDQP